ncbi:D-glycero-beta-D-manno-heptose 1,7-bisphosphate 7-phosphatase [Candidatus Thioglobus autotrophicus]|uniref:D-glycero-beta-D-manno-heptose 1,7-bisphosphate 7-phosphatase n=1 Tax=Candidatus Thioglobus autotrophicus TaxID=1705394 RepID=UPI00299F12E3|nr:D-glycero-beta-D-manno-heptose 1,7-bisphosphate 7-phosphatase [Candidatus Thioglobus autotrophicus]WPE16255.1 D-glycero-beta-D-manno-heptose 1,7-bisphosphate 7-phosphatase [Candidatus Thioglobus autotrophicus]
MKVIFLDRDGVINKEVGYLHKIEDFEFINGVFDACLDFQSSNYKIIIVTNQSGIERGYYSEKDFHTVTDWMLNQFKDYGVRILDVFYCPHGPESSCDCRKPKPGMFNQANAKYHIDMGESWMIGDKEADIQAANSAGISNTVLVKSGHNIDEKNSKAKFVFDSIKQVSTVL